MNEEIMRKLEAMQVINRQLHEKLEQAIRILQGEDE
jgi:hypothetical protein